jgi:membrane-bound inhibitor of C-type lysozyme
MRRCASRATPTTELAVDAAGGDGVMLRTLRAPIAMPRTALAFVVLATALAACQQEPTKEEIEAVKSTFECTLAGERIVIRFDATLHEARVIMPDGNTIALHQIPSASGAPGARFSNGTFELTGKGSELRLARDGGTATELVDCKNPPMPTKKS